MEAHLNEIEQQVKTKTSFDLCYWHDGFDSPQKVYIEMEGQEAKAWPLGVLFSGSTPRAMAQAMLDFCQVEGGYLGCDWEKAKQLAESDNF